MNGNLPSPAPSPNEPQVNRKRIQPQEDPKQRYPMAQAGQKGSSYAIGGAQKLIGGSFVSNDVAADQRLKKDHYDNDDITHLDRQTDVAYEDEHHDDYNDDDEDEFSSTSYESDTEQEDSDRAALAYIFRYEQMVRQQEAEHHATTLHLRPLFDRLRVIGSPTNNISSGSSYRSADNWSVGSMMSKNSLVGPNNTWETMAYAKNNINTPSKSTTNVNKPANRGPNNNSSKDTLSYDPLRNDFGEGNERDKQQNEEMEKLDDTEVSNLLSYSAMKRAFRILKNSSKNDSSNSNNNPEISQQQKQVNMFSEQVMSTDKQLMMVLQELTSKHNYMTMYEDSMIEQEYNNLVDEVEGGDLQSSTTDNSKKLHLSLLLRKKALSFPEFLHCYKIVVSGMMILEMLPNSSSTSLQDKNREDLNMGLQYHRMKTTERTLSMLRTFRPSSGSGSSPDGQSSPSGTPQKVAASNKSNQHVEKATSTNTSKTINQSSQNEKQVDSFKVQKKKDLERKIQLTKDTNRTTTTNSLEEKKISSKQITILGSIAFIFLLVFCFSSYFSSSDIQRQEADCVIPINDIKGNPDITYEKLLKEYQNAITQISILKNQDIPSLESTLKKAKRSREILEIENKSAQLKIERMKAEIVNHQEELNKAHKQEQRIKKESKKLYHGGNDAKNINQQKQNRKASSKSTNQYEQIHKKLAGSEKIQQRENDQTKGSFNVIQQIRTIFKAILTPWKNSIFNVAFTRFNDNKK